MVRTATTPRSKALWATCLSMWLLTGFVSVNTFALNMGAVMHDIYCQDH